MSDHNEADHVMSHDVIVDNAPAEADVRFIEEQLIAYNIATTGYTDYRPLAVFARDDEWNDPSRADGIHMGRRAQDRVSLGP